MGDENVQVYPDVFDEEIILTGTVWAVILEKHPEVNDFVDQIGSVLSSPDEVRRSSSDQRVVLYYRYESQILGGKWLVVVAKRVDRNFISTIYATTKIKAGEVLWKK